MRKSLRAFINQGKKIDTTVQEKWKPRIRDVKDVK